MWQIAVELLSLMFIQTVAWSAMWGQSVSVSQFLCQMLIAYKNIGVIDSLVVGCEAKNTHDKQPLSFFLCCVPPRNW